MSNLRLSRTPHNARAAARGPVLAVLALLLFGAAGWMFYRSWSDHGEGNIPDTPESSVLFVCEACGKEFRLTGREIHEAMFSYDPRVDPEGAASKFPCKFCGKRAGVRPPEEGLEPE